jgi:hypothetical protein
MYSFTPVKASVLTSSRPVRRSTIEEIIACTGS